MTTTDLTVLVRDAAFYGITLTVSADPADGTAEYIVNGPVEAPARHTTAEDAAEDLTHRITSVQDAADAALTRARRWAEVRATVADDVTAWAVLAADINDALPDGCDIPVPDRMDIYGLSGWGTITSAVSVALAEWTANNRDRAARKALTAALDAEDAEMRDATAEEQQVHRPDYWQTVVELWQAVQVVRDPGDRPHLRRGRVLTDTDTRRNISWRHFGVVTPVGQDEVDAEVAQIDRAREVVAEVAERHRHEADRLAQKMRL